MRLADMLRGHARATPDKPIVVDQQGLITFAELDALSDRVAVGLEEMGIAFGDRVAILLENGTDFVTAFMSCNKAGAIAVPLNPKLARGEVSHVLADSRPKAIFYSEATRQGIAGSVVPDSISRIAVDSAELGDVELLDLAESPGSVRRVPPEFPDCMIGYTSGTTGDPKGVLLTDANFIIANGLMNGFMWGLSGTDRLLVTTPMVHRTGFGRVVNAICHGSTVFSRPSFDPEEVCTIVNRESITVMSMVPTVGRLLIDQIEGSPRDFASVSRIVATGEAFPTELKRRIMEALPQVSIHSYFAMTEVGLVASLGPEQQLTHPGSVGRPAPGVEVELWGEDGLPVQEGEVGEVCVRTGEPGRWLTMRAYFNRPGLTDESIIDGWFRTGDMARFDDEGFLYIVDRKKDMVLTGGYNVYSKDVEQVIRDLAGVVDVAVIGVPDAMYGERVVAVIEKAETVELTQADVVEHCRTNLASYKKPREIVFVDELPRTSVGKPNKAALRNQFEA